MKKISFLAFACVLGATFYSAQAATLVSGGSGTSGAMVARAGSLRVNANTQPTSAPSVTSGAESTRIAISGINNSRIKPSNTGSNVVAGSGATVANNANYINLLKTVEDLQKSLNEFQNALATVQGQIGDTQYNAALAKEIADKAQEDATAAVKSANDATESAVVAKQTAADAVYFVQNESPAVMANKRIDEIKQELIEQRDVLKGQKDALEKQRADFENKVKTDAETMQIIGNNFNEVSANLKKLDEATGDLAQQVVLRPSDEEFKKQIEEVNKKIDTVSEIAVKTQNGLEQLNSNNEDINRDIDIIRNGLTGANQLIAENLRKINDNKEDFDNFKDGDGLVRLIGKEVNNNQTITDLTQQVGSIKDWKDGNGADGFNARINKLQGDITANTNKITENTGKINQNANNFTNFFVGTGDNSLSKVIEQAKTGMLTSSDRAAIISEAQSGVLKDSDVSGIVSQAREGMLPSSAEETIKNSVFTTLYADTGDNSLAVKLGNTTSGVGMVIKNMYTVPATTNQGTGGGN